MKATKIKKLLPEIEKQKLVNSVLEAENRFELLQVLQRQMLILKQKMIYF